VLRASVSSLVEPGERRARVATCAALGGWVLVVTLCQHPQRTLDRLPRLDRLGLLIPNWRFFSPDPSRHDFHVMYRLLEEDGHVSSWQQAVAIEPRRWRQAIWNPDKRRDKALFDLCSQLSRLVMLPGAKWTETMNYRLLSNMVARTIVERQEPGAPPPQGYQFLVGQHTGHDHSIDPTYLLHSAFEPFQSVVERLQLDRPAQISA
jgi:hypothetical protein